MEPLETAAASPHLPAEEDVNQSVGQTTTNQAEEQSSAGQDQMQPRLKTNDWMPQQPGGHSLQLEFQDSNLSPALSLLPVTSGVEHNFPEYSLFQQSDAEFAPLRAYPDVSMASERFHFPPQDHTTHVSECDSLSQHPLTQATILSEEGEISCSSISPGEQGEQEEKIASADGRRGTPPRDETGGRIKEPETRSNPPDNPVGELVEDETFFLSKDVRAKHLLELLQKDVGVPDSSSSAVSSSSETSVKSTLSFTEGQMAVREGPPGEASFPLQQRQQHDGVSDRGQSRAPSSEVCNVTVGSRSTQPDESSEELHRELLSEAESKNKRLKSPTPPGQSVTPSVREMSEGKPSVIRSNLSGAPWTGPFSAGVEQIHREQDLWSSGNQTGIDGSYLGFLPQSQSTPGFFKAPPKTKLGQLSAIESSKESSDQSSTGTSPQPAVPVEDAPGPDTAHQGQDGSSEKVQSLPSLNYIQKVDAWRANQSSGKTSLFDSLALQGFSGNSPKKKAYEAVSDKLNRILSQQVRSLQQPLVSGSANHNVPQSSSTTLSALSSPRRGEAVGSTPSDMDNTGSAPLSASPYGRSQSHSSLNTVVTSAHKDQQTDRPSEKDETHSQDDAHHHHHHPSTSLQPVNVMSLGHFSDVSLDRDSALSSSQDSYRGVKLGASAGASSVVSLEIDNYVPHWTSKLSTSPPLPKPRELNIDERIPLYLHNLGIDQSPSTILTPFAPRGPIREPEFSPTDLCTIKGSIGTSTKSTQPSEGSSPHKSEFSRSSIVSVDSTISIPFSLDSLGPAVSIPERTRRTTPPSDTEAVQRQPRLAVLSQSDEDSHYSSILQNSQQQQQQQDGSSTSSQNINEPGDKFDVSLSVNERNTGSLLQTSHSLEDSFVSSKALLEIRKLLSHADNVVSTGSSAASSASHAAPHPVSDEDVLLSQMKKSSRLQDSSFSSSSSSSSSAGDLRTRSSQLWTRSSSDSMLTSEKLRQSSVGRESVTSSGQPFIAAPATITPKTPQDSTVSTGAGVSLVLSESARRTEPEGCSAAPPDTIPTQPLVIQPPPAVSTQQLTSTPVDAAQMTEEEEERATLRGPVQSISPSPVLEESDQGVMSDGSSESSLAVRVAQLLQSESSATVMSSTPSVTDQEDNKAREWIKLKVSGQQCEPLELDKEDRKRIEEIKKELLLKNPMTSQSSTESETSAASGARAPRENNQSRSAETFASVSDANNQPPLGPGTNSTTERLHQDLEAKVTEIAAREGVSLSTKTPRAFTSITISTCRRSTSPSPPSSSSPAPPLSPAPEPLRLTELSTDKPPVDEEERAAARSSLHPRNVTQERRDAVGGQFEEPPPNRDDVTTKHDGTQSFRRDVNNSSQTTGSSPARTGHVSHVHLTLSPKVTDHASSTRVHSSHALSRLPREESVPYRHSSSAASSPDEGVGLSSPPEWYETREPRRRLSPDKPDAAALFKSAAPQERTTTQSFTPRHTPAASPRPFTTETPVPALLPYKPHGSEELFYVPQTEADVSDTTMESSHPGSDDAVPPHFSSEVLGRQDPGLDRGVAIRHAEGIYSKRLKTAAFKMNEPRHRGASESSPGLSQTPKPSSQVSAAFTRVPLPSNQEVSKRDQGTSPIQFHHYDRPEPSRERHERLHVLQTSVRQRGREGHQPRRGSDLPESSFQQSSSALDQLWQKFCDQWTTEGSRPTRDREESLIERLERLSRLIHSTRPTNVSGAQEEGGYRPEDKLGWRREDATLRRTDVKRSLHGEERGGRRVEPSQPEEDDSRVSSSSTFSHSSSHSLHLSPANRDESSETWSTMSGSVSTVDTARLIRAFGADRVQRLKTTPSLSKLYGTINRQKEGREQRRGRNTPPLVLTPSDTTGTDESVAAADSASSTSSYTVPSHRGPSRTLAAKKTVKLVNKGVQAGDLEIVNNGTRRHTRDVGTTFPSPGDARALGQISPSSSSGVRGRGGQRSPSKTHGIQKLRKSRRSPSNRYPKGVSWFISADNLRSEARKENQPEEPSPPWRPSTVWFEPYSRVRPWREPLRQRRVLEDRNEQHGVMHPTEPEPEPDPEPTTKTTSSGLARVSLQEALELSRPEFLSRSRQRVKRLALQVEERKLQAVFTRERHDVFYQLGGAERLLRPPGTALIRRAVPRKEMIQRSKQIYENLPEVTRRREEERRKAEYESYRLNAQLYNKRITNRVLGRRSAWQ